MVCVFSRCVGIIYENREPELAQLFCNLGLSFKENVSDLRNSRVPEIAKELSEFGLSVLINDPNASAEDAHHEYGLALTALNDFTDLDAVIVAVAHDQYKQLK